MKVRGNRTHFAGASNRQKQVSDKAVPMDKTSILLEKSFAKSKSMYHRTQNFDAFGQKIQTSTRLDPFKGQHTEFQSKRFDPKNIKPYKYQRMKIAKLPPHLTFQNEMNKQVSTIKEQFEGKDINMHKLHQLQVAFQTNTADKRNLKAYFNKIANENKVVGKEQLKKMVKQYGFDINNDEAELMMKLTDKNSNGSLGINQFINLLTKQNVYFSTLNFPRETYQNQQFFTPKVHEVLRNKFYKLKQAFKIYTSRHEDIDINKFNYTMKKLDLTDLVLTQQQRQHIFDKFKDQKGTFNPQALICLIAQQEDVRLNLKKPSKNEFENQLKVYEQKQYNKKQQVREYSMKNISNLQYQKQFQKATQIVRQLRKLNRNKNVMDEVMKEQQINKKSLVKNVEKLLQAEGFNFKKYQYEAFLALLDFNKNGNINKSNATKFLLEQSEKDAMERIQRKHRDLAPILNPAQAPQIQYEFDEATAKNTLKKIIDHKMNPQLKQLFVKMDEDHDGYLSNNQFKKKIKNLHILQDWEINNLVGYMDEEKKGFLTFKNFCQKFTIKDQFPLVQQPKLKSNSCSQWTSTRKDFIRSQNKYVYQAPSKYSAWPSRLIDRDLSLIQANQKSGMYISQTQRFINNKNDFASQAKKSNQKIYENKIRRISDWQQKVENSAKMTMKKQQEKQISRNYFMRLSKQIYEDNCHSFH